MPNKYRLLVGQHIETIPGSKTQENPLGIEATYNAGDTFESDSRLEKFNSPGHSPKFERLQDDVMVGPKPRKAKPAPEPVADEDDETGASENPLDALEGMSVAELFKFAKENDIDLKGARTKVAIIQAIRDFTQGDD